MHCIVIVEDDEPLRVLAESLMQEAGYQSVTAASVSEALALFESPTDFDLLFTDLNLHDEATGGIQVAQRARELRPDLPVVYTSGAGVTDGTRALFVDGALFLPKPYTHEALATALDTALQSSNTIGRGHPS